MVIDTQTRSQKRHFSSLKIFLVAVAAVCLPLVALSSRAAAAACQQPSTDYGSVTTSTNIPAAATYRIWSRINVPSSTSNTYLLQLDGNKCYTVGGGNIQANTWVWVAYQGGNTGSTIDVALTQGTHALKLIGNKADVKVDRLVFASDLACVPSGSGDNCNVPADTTAPVARITAPSADASVNGTVTVNATASDASGVSKVEFYINGVLTGTDTSAPYTFSWNTAAVPNGTQALTVRAYDAAGNVGTDNIKVTIQNGDRQAPTVPTDLKATATAYNAVTLSWKASTDDTQVKGYHVFRDGVPLADTGAVASYTDRTVSSGVSYSYKLAAYDAAGNVSALSGAVSVKTPTVADTQAPTVPTDLSAAAVSTTQVNLSWKASTDNIGVVAYDVYRATAGTTATKIGSSATTDFADTDLTASTTYRYSVIARDAVGNVSKTSHMVAVTTLASPPPAQGRTVISGTVSRQDSSKKIAYAAVLFNEGSHRHIYQTNRHGAYAIRDLEAGRYNLIFRANGFFSKTISVKADGPKTTLNVSLQKR